MGWIHRPCKTHSASSSKTDKKNISGINEVSWETMEMLTTVCFEINLSEKFVRGVPNF